METMFILIKKIRVQNANAAAGLTWGFPAITHFLGFVHNLQIKLSKSSFGLNHNIKLLGTAVISHTQQVHTFGQYNDRFVQSKNPPYLSTHDKKNTPPIIEEAKMNMTVSLVIPIQGYIGENNQVALKTWLQNTCLMQRLAGGSILDIDGVDFFSIGSSEQYLNVLKQLKRKLLPGFVLRDRSDYLAEHYQELQKCTPDAEILDAWLDFASLKYRARPVSDLIEAHLSKNIELQAIWHKHCSQGYSQKHIPIPLNDYFSQIQHDEKNKKLIEQWHNYCHPTDKTNAHWEHVPKPQKGWLVPIMNGYKAITPVYKASEIEGTRDNETDVCFVEATHSIGEWLGVNRIRTFEDLINCAWQYEYESNWYLCKKIPKERLEAQRNSVEKNNNTSDY